MLCVCALCLIILIINIVYDIVPSPLSVLMLYGMLFFKRNKQII